MVCHSAVNVIDVSLRPWYLHRRRLEVENTRAASRFVVFLRSLLVATDSPANTAHKIPDTGEYGNGVTAYLVRPLQSAQMILQLYVTPTT